MALVPEALEARRFAMVWFRRCMQVRRWAQVERGRQEALAAVSAFSSPDDRVVLSGADAVMLPRLLRKGYVEDAPAVEQRGVEFHRRHGESSTFYFDDSGPRLAVFRLLPKVAKGARRTFCCQQPARGGGLEQARASLSMPRNPMVYGRG